MHPRLADQPHLRRRHSGGAGLLRTVPRPAARLLDGGASVSLPVSPVRGQAGGRALRAAAALAAAAGLVLAAGCAGSDAQEQVQDVDGGYVSGDGTVQTWSEAERNDPVELTGSTYEEEQIDLADWRGDVVVLNFWYAACPPCRAEAPDLAETARDYADDGVHMLGVNHTDDAGVAAMQGVVPLSAMPSTVVLDRDGRVAGRILGQIDLATLHSLIDDTLAEEG